MKFPRLQSTETTFVDTPEGIFTASGVWFRTREASLYAYAGLRSGCHMVNFTPSVMLEVPALVELARTKRRAIAGKDGKTGQTL